MANITIYTTRICPFCIRAKQLLQHKGLAFDEISVDRHPERRQEMMEKSQRHTVPQIWVGEAHVGGCDDLFMLERSGELDTLVAAANEPA